MTPAGEPPFQTVFIANRGEIALRIARTCREMGIRTVAAYSTPDRDSAAVRLADRAIPIGPAPARRSYLNMAALVEAARQTGADAVHPGYGFLSEDPDFAEICQASGLAFIGPPPEVTAHLGDKARVRGLMADAGLPVLPGTAEPVPAHAARSVAARVGYPLIVKAAAGGGGRGLVIVRDPAELDRAHEGARAAGQALFGNGGVYLERYVEDARHVEVQVLADAHGQVIHLGERDCTIQRRHQKLVEETPAPALPPGVADAMGAAAVRGAASLGLTGVATFEFLLDQAGEFWFLEINGRIQVEHPVTEMVTGIDLVREQILAAAGRPLGLRQEDVVARGVAVECRINAENADAGFVPTPGMLETVVLPGGPFTRVDSHIYPGWCVTPDYDSLLAKVVAWAPDRDAALARLDRALTELRIAGPGIRTTREFLREILAHPLFRDAKHTTSLVEQACPPARPHLSA